MIDLDLADETMVGPTGPAAAGRCHLAKVVSVDDPARRHRVQVRLLAFDGVGAQDGPIWARVAAPFAGKDRGAFFLPGVEDEVLVAFVNDDPRFPVVLGGLWHGTAPAPEQLGGDGKRIDRWTIVGRAGTRIAIVEEREGQARISFSTPGNVSAELTESAGGKITLVAAGTTITIDSAGVSIQTAGSVTVNAGQVQAIAGQVTVNAAMSSFSGIVRCDTLIATTVVATTYTPGAGNVW